MRALTFACAAAVLAGCGNDISIGRSACSEYWYQDKDQDGFGDPDTATQGELSKECALPSDWINVGGDCNDSDPLVNPETVWYEDRDGDGDGNPNVTVFMCNPGEGWVLNGDDCDDTKADVNSNTVWFLDDDGDDWGLAGDTLTQCRRPDGYAAQVGDCDDTDPDINPGAEEICNEGVDDDCDGLADLEDDSLALWSATVQYYDGDGDTYGDDATQVISCDATILRDHVLLGGDCEDEDFLINPGAPEVCNDIDDDCDTFIDDDDDNLEADEIVYRDSDGDGFGDPDTVRPACQISAGFVTNDADCDDADADTYPEAAPFDSPYGCLKDADDDDWGDQDVIPGVQAGTDCDDDDPDAWPGIAIYDSEVACMRDEDGDGYGDAEPTDPGVTPGTDCNDFEPFANPSMDETCATAFDDDCDGAINEADAIDAELWYPDGDGDGYGRGMGVRTCTPPPLHARTPDDCDDTDDTVHPGAEEFCNGIDDDCNTTIDDHYALDAFEWYPDDDLDGFGDELGAPRMACDRPERYAANNLDCNDDHNGVYPSAPELCDGVNNDCDLFVWDLSDEDGLASYEDVDGFWEDLTDTYDWTDDLVLATWRAETSGTMHLCTGLYYGRIVVERNIELTIQGKGRDLTTLVGNDGSGTVTSTEIDTALVIRGVRFQDANQGTGGAVYARNGTLLIEDCAFVNNSANLTGGALAAQNLDEAVIRDTIFESNETSTFSGGAASLTANMSVTIEDCTFLDNRSNGFNRLGGALELGNNDAVTITRSHFEGNFADYGGAIGAYGDAGDEIYTESCTFVDNTTDNAGGGIRVEDATYIDDNSEFSGNVANFGGAIALVNGDDHELNGTELIGNEADTDGGGLRCWADGGRNAVTVTGASIHDNRAQNGGGIGLEGMQLEIDGGSILRNEVIAGFGSGIYLKLGTLDGTSVNMGVGGDDNEDSEDVYVESIDRAYTYGESASFTCDEAGC
ncbi:MAG: hypothetical protein ACI8PZ_005034 [Myxococcota bacterium]|jgi:hypothetical protein